MGTGRGEAVLRDDRVITSADLSLVLLVGASLMIRTMLVMRRGMGTSMLLQVVGLLACYWPARRASIVCPVNVLRYELGCVPGPPAIVGMKTPFSTNP
jgi:hypothetical protein